MSVEKQGTHEIDKGYLETVDVGQSKKKSRHTCILHSLIDITFLRFLMVGVVNTIIGTGTMFAFYNLLHVNYWISSAANYIVGSIVSYFLNKYFTFRINDFDKKYIIRFVINISMCYLLAYGIARPIAAILLSTMPVVVQENGAMLVGMGLFIILNYFGQRYFAFSEKGKKNNV